MYNKGWTFYFANELDKLHLCTDGAVVMTGRHAGVVQRIKAVPPQIDVLASKDIKPGLHEVMNTAVTIVNFF